MSKRMCMARLIWGSDPLDLLARWVETNRVVQILTRSCQVTHYTSSRHGSMETLNREGGVRDHPCWVVVNPIVAVANGSRDVDKPMPTHWQSTAHSQCLRIGNPLPTAVGKPIRSGLARTSRQSHRRELRA
jgi:hypothetical protein